MKTDEEMLALGYTQEEVDFYRPLAEAIQRSKDDYAAMTEEERTAHYERKKPLRDLMARLKRLRVETI